MNVQVLSRLDECVMWEMECVRSPYSAGPDCPSDSRTMPSEGQRVIFHKAGMQLLTRSDCLQG